MRVDTIVRSLTSTIYSSNTSNKKVTDFFKPKVSKSHEGMSTNLQNASVEQDNDSLLNEKQNEETVLKEGKLFHPPKHEGFPKTGIGARDWLCQQHFPWLHYNERYVIFLIQSANIKYICSQLSN